MIVQGKRAEFTEPTAHLHVALEHPTQRGTLLVVAFTLRGCPSPTPSIETIRDTFGSARQWRLAHDQLRSGGERVSTWFRLGSHPGNLEIIAETCNSVPITGSAVALETAGLSAGAAVAALAELLAARAPADEEHA